MQGGLVKRAIAWVLVIIGLASAILSTIATSVTTCMSVQGVSTCSPPNYGSLIVYLGTSGAILIGGIYLMVSLRGGGGKAAPSATPPIK